jgi:CO/xanthine dehydrogenase FAD-binding subunit
MITSIHKPEKLEDALKFLARDTDTRPLGGGTLLNSPHDADFEVVDLSKLGLGAITAKGSTLTLGATTTLQVLLDWEGLPPALKTALTLEVTRNLRQVATVAGTLVAADGRSPFAAALLALDPVLTIHPDSQEVGLGEFLPLRGADLKGKLITAITLSTTPTLHFEYVARSPADRPIVTVAIARWDSGRTRVALGGFGKAPHLAMDGRDPSGGPEIVENVYLTATDEWATAEYRTAAALELVTRILGAAV